jgi:hypothetical protein
MNRLLKVLLLTSCLLLTSNLLFAQVKTIYNSWSADAVFNNPSIVPIMTITSSWKITKIGDYHYNFGAGQDPAAVNGKISLYDNTSGALIGVWTASTVANLDPAGNHCLGPNMCWAAYPNVILKPGTYKIVDSDPSTWSYSTTEFFGAGPNWAPNQGFSYVLATSATPRRIGTIILNESKFESFGALSFPFTFNVPQLIVLCELGVVTTPPARCVNNVVSDIVSVTNNKFGEGVVAMSSNAEGSLHVPVGFPLPPVGSPTIVLSETGKTQALTGKAGLVTTNPGGSPGPKITLSASSDLETGATTSDVLTVSTQ